MENATTVLNRIRDQECDLRLKDIYGDDAGTLAYQRARYQNAIERYMELFGDGEIEIYSAPGRTEVCGNHTDHQNGMVLAAAIDLDTLAIVGKNEQPVIEIFSEGYPLITIDLSDLELTEEEKGTTPALVKGVLKGMQERGMQIGPFRAYITSDVLSGSGLSSSAAFEAMTGTILSGLFNDMKVSDVDIAMVGQYAENVYFGKPCGLMDQMACSVGGFVHIDFADPHKPTIHRIAFDLAQKGYSLCIVDTKGSHASLTDDYAAIPAEMGEVAAFFGRTHLAFVDQEEFFDSLPRLLSSVGHRSVLRAIHFFGENARVEQAVRALETDSFEEFLGIINASGNSSYKYLQNVYSNKEEQTQPVAIALALSEYLLKDNGVCRVHGGGFAGTIQVFVRNSCVTEYKEAIEKALGAGTCHVLKIRKYGGIRVF